MFEQLEQLLQEHEGVFQKHKADLGRCTVIEHKIDLEPGAVPWREGPRRMTRFRTEKANEEVNGNGAHRTFVLAMGLRHRHGQENGKPIAHVLRVSES